MGSCSIATWPPYKGNGPYRSLQSSSRPSTPSIASNNVEGPEEQPRASTASILELQNSTPLVPQNSRAPDRSPEPTEVTTHVDKEGCHFYQFRENGDKLTLVVGSDECTQITIVVSPDVVRNLSKIWERLTDETKQRTKSKPWQSSRKQAKERRQIVLPYDDPVMMLQVMKIAHYDFNGLYTTLDFGQILAMALISHRFQTNRLLIPFLANWAISHKDKILQQGYEQWLFIAWQFGFEDDYLRLSKHLATHCQVDCDGRLLSLAGDEVLIGHFPEGALAYIRAIRIRTLQSFLDTIYTTINDMINTNTCVANGPISTITDSERTECTLLNYGSMIRELRVLGFWPEIHIPGDVVHAARITDSLAEITETLTSVQVLTWRHNHHRSHDSEEEGALVGEDATMGRDKRHKWCDSGKLLADKITDVLADMEDCISNDTRNSLKQNAGMCQGLKKEA